MQIKDDNELLSLFHNSSTKEDGFTAIVKKYQEKLYWHIRRMVITHDDADDVLQNTFIKVWKGLENFREDRGFMVCMFINSTLIPFSSRIFPASTAVHTR